MKTGKWFHGKETKKHNPTKEIEYHLLATPPSTTPVKTSPKIVKTGFPASSITKAQLGEQAEERRKQQKANENKELNSRHPPVSLTASDDSGSSTGSSKNNAGINKKHVTFDQNDHLLMMSNLNPNINLDDDINNNDTSSSSEGSNTRAGLKV